VLWEQADTLECQAGCIADPLLRRQYHFFRTWPVARDGKGIPKRCQG
jgi:hypothetical protein